MYNILKYYTLKLRINSQKIRFPPTPTKNSFELFVNILFRLEILNEKPKHKRFNFTSDSTRNNKRFLYISMANYRQLVYTP